MDLLTATADGIAHGAAELAAPEELASATAEPAVLPFCSAHGAREDCCCGMGNQRIDAADRPVSSAAAAGGERRAAGAAAPRSPLPERR